MASAASTITSAAVCAVAATTRGEASSPAARACSTLGAGDQSGEEQRSDDGSDADRRLRAQDEGAAGLRLAMIGGISIGLLVMYLTGLLVTA
jgi:hypothetical protein